MNGSLPLYSVTLTAADPETRDRKLDEAVDEAIAKAIAAGGHGVLVTRRDHRTFTVELTESVPYGTTQELDATAPFHGLA